MSDTSTQYNDSAGETTKAGDPVCACAKDPTPPPPQDRPCKHDTLTIQCSHHGRKVTITPEFQFPKRDTLEVVAGPEKAPDMIECTTELIEGPCSEHEDNVFDLYPIWCAGAMKPALAEKTSSKMMIEACSESFDLLDYILHFLPFRPKTRLYQIDAWTHDGFPLTGYVRAYPDLRWQVNAFEAMLNIEAGEAADDDSDFISTLLGLFGKSDKRLFTFAPLSIEWSHDGGGPKKISVEIEDKLKALCKWIDLGALVAQLFLDFLADMLDADLSLSSKIGLSGEWGWKEIKGSPFCGIEGKVKMDFSPLLKIEVTIDITVALLEGIGAAFPPALPICKTIIRLKKLGDDSKESFEELEKKIKAGTAPDYYASGYITGGIYLKIGGGVDFSVEWERKAEAQAWTGAANDSASGKVNFAISAELEGHGAAKGLGVVLSAGATVKATAESGFTASDIDAQMISDRPALACRLTWEGITISFLGKFDGNVALATKESDESPASKSASFSGTKGKSETSAKLGFAKGDKSLSGGGEVAFKYTWFQPHVWNYTDTPYPITVWDESKDGTWVQKEQICEPKGPFRFLEKK